MIPGWLKTLISRPASNAAEPGVIAPDQRFIAVGDIHGRMDLLQSLLDRVDLDCPLVFLGDYVDRGPHSAHVLRHLYQLEQNDNRPVTCLLGNHEEMLLRFVDEPKRNAQLWMLNGGLQTIASFGLGDLDGAAIGRDAEGAATRLREAMGDALLDWLRTRPLTWTSGNVTAVHAALDPNRAVTRQQRQTCLWGHPEFPKTARRDGHWVLRGHVIVDKPDASNGVISIDTGAVFTGRLTAADISSEGVHFISTS
ncbi:metallophosphoesterase family protein [Ruegeria sp. HKCCD7255]|uniref:metallophosphoesterase family protein n=1 Tax=Ruegeria sp. HKCCD7255 TaxID=2683004 RepID=UPI00148873D6|nr:metallophosphoesterase family protein [Ruegeria sp. HKCCD7255]